MLKSLELKSVYDSEKCDLVKDLIVPLLSNSSTYMRGVGYFSSGWLRLASHGIQALIENGGKAQIITSPILSESDLNAFIAGEEAKKSSILKKAIEESFHSLQEEMNRNTLNALSWMVADDLLEFRFAIPRSAVVASDYHDKVGIFADEQNNTVAIHGSLNDSLKGSFNGEAFSVFKSWESGQNEYVEIHKKRLSQLWSGENKQFHSMSIPETVKNNFIKLRTTETRPYALKRPESETPEGLNPTEGISLPVKLRSYQGKAIRRWLQNNCFGVLGMATGTGKTLTALSAAVISYFQSKKMAVIVLVPYLHLLDQWAEDCRKCGFSPVLCSSEHPQWQIKVKGKIQDYNIGSIDNVCIVAVHATASSEKFEKATRRLPQGHSLVIGDEVHNLGGAKLRSAMLPVYGKRLGLSATPKRWFDDEGSDVILDYFGEVCFEFSLEDAIKNNYLTPYRYLPEKIILSCDEQEEYETLSKRISKLSFSNNSKDKDKSDSLKYCLLERARLISAAENKIPRMIAIFKELITAASSRGEEVKHILVYCAPGTHKDVLSKLSQLNLRCHEFVHSVNLKER